MSFFFHLLVFVSLVFRHVTQTYASSSLSFNLDFIVCNLSFVRLQNLLLLFKINNQHLVWTFITQLLSSLVTPNLCMSMLNYIFPSITFHFTALF